MYRHSVNFNELHGKTIIKIDTDEYEYIRFHCSDGSEYLMTHEQDCCESVNIEDINGELDDLLNMPILLAEESQSSGDKKSKYDESSTWTFYKLATNKGYVNIRWYGTSNGYYSETANFLRIN